VTLDKIAEKYRPRIKTIVHIVLKFQYRACFQRRKVIVSSADAMMRKVAQVREISLLGRRKSMVVSIYATNKCLAWSDA